MIPKSPLRKAYLLIKRNRSRRKMDMYKLAFGVLVDRTTAIYILLIGGYLFASIFIVGDMVGDYYEQFMMIEEIATTRFWFIFTVLPIRYITQSFGKPGVIFSSTEYQLSLLPYHRKDIWFLCVLEKWIKRIVTYAIIGCLILLITPFSYGLVLKYILLLICFDILMTIPQWKLYQKRFFTKLGWLCLMLVINSVAFFLHTPFVGIMLLGLLVIVNIQLRQTLFKRINWDKVTEISDFQLWTMWLISKASEVDIKRQKKYSIFQNLSIRKKPFKYRDKAIYHRLWFLYFGKNYQLVLQSIGAMFVLLTVFRFMNDFLFHLGLAVVIYMYTSILASFFKDQFQAEMIHILPWDLSGYKRSFFKWSIYGGIILFIPIGLYLGANITIWLPFQLLFYCSTFLFIYHVKMDQAIALLGKKFISADLWEGIGFILLVGIVFSWKYPVLVLGFIIVLWLLLRYRKSFTPRHHS